jgi:hypothetical protein
LGLGTLQPINNGHKYGGDDDPKQLIPVEEWDADELWILEVVERGPEHDDERDEEKEEKPGAVLSLRTDEHKVPPFVDEMRLEQHLPGIRKKDS